MSFQPGIIQCSGQNSPAAFLPDVNKVGNITSFRKKSTGQLTISQVGLKGIEVDGGWDAFVWGNG
jgi:hypothetical protein